jgi:hypothetical protein
VNLERNQPARAAAHKSVLQNRWLQLLGIKGNQTVFQTIQDDKKISIYEVHMFMIG